MTALADLMRFAPPIEQVLPLIRIGSGRFALFPMKMSDMAEAPEKESPSVRFTDRIRARCPAVLPPAIELAAAQSLMTPSQYIRAVIDRLRIDGIDLNSRPGPARIGSFAGASK